MSCRACGRQISRDVFLCPFCHSTQFEVGEEATTVQSVPPAPVSPAVETAICPRSWCRHEYTVGTAVCPSCFQPLPTAGPVVAGPRISSVRLVLPGGATVEVVPGRDLVIGRDSLDARIADGLDPYDGVSRRHAELTVSDTCATVTDLGSTNGTFVNGARAAAAGVPLEPGHHQLRLGRQAVIAVDVLTAVSG
ncbi:FHA domain-containing protein [Kribbella sp. NPDC051718]|uniref:FHA domain-containing protein n=1 Tax=Kribbella sp. NPDC051718 TaxID=3155168 RepID=UPI003419241F